MPSFWGELRRRRVIRVMLAYAVVAWLLIQVAAILLPTFDAPDWSMKALVIVLLCGLPVTLILAWIFDITPQGIVVSDSTDVTQQTHTQRRSSFKHGSLKKFKLSELSLANVQQQPMISRAAESQILRERLQQTVAGQGGIVLISGEAGLGKTRLGEEALSIGHELDMLPLSGHAYEELGAPFIVTTEILEEIIRIFPKPMLRNVLGNTAAELTRLVPDLHRIFPDIPPPLELPPGQQQRYLFNALLDMTVRLSAARPLVILLDDLHWADESSIMMLEHFVPHVSKHPILIVITYRDTEHDLRAPFKRALGKLHKLPHVLKIPLKQFSHADIKNYLETVSGKPPPDELCELLLRDTNGNVFFVQSVYQHLNEQGLLFDAAGNWSSDVLNKCLDLPESVRIVTAQRLQKLDQATQEFLNTAAVLGYRFRVSDLQAVLENPDSVIHTIEQADQANLLKVAQTGPETRYEFVHGLARQAILSQIPLLQKQQIHYQIATALQHNAEGHTQHTQHAADVAYHLMNSGNHASTANKIEWLSKAGHTALKATAFEQAQELFNAALDLVSESAQRADLLTGRATASLNLGHIEHFSQDMLQAFELYKADRNAVSAAAICNELSFMMVWNNQVDEAIQLIETGLDLVGEEASPARCQLLSSLGTAYGTSDHPLSALEYHDQAVNMAKELDDQSLLADAYQNKGLMYWATFRGRDLETTAALGAELHRQLNQDWKLAQCLWMQEAGLSFQGRFAEAATIAEELQPLAQSQENYGPLLCSELFTALRHQANGELEQAIEFADRSILHCEMANFPWRSAMIGIRSVMQLLHGKLDAAREDITAASINTLPSGMWAGTDVAFWIAGKAFLGDADTLAAYHEVKERLPDSDEPRTGGQITLVQGAIETLMTLKEYPEAARLYPVMANVLAEEQAILGFSFGLFERYAGMAASAGEQWALAEQHFSKALEQARDLPFKVETPRILYWQADMLKRRLHEGDIEKADALLREAKELSERLGMEGFVGFGVGFH